MSSSSTETADRPYRLTFKESALKEWGKLNPVIQEQFAKKLRQRLQNPLVPADKLRGMPGCYKIKLRTSGFRLVYEVLESEITVVVIAVGKRERGKAYIKARDTLEE